jgi:20S proteasome alpha/beta subunit
MSAEDTSILAVDSIYSIIEDKTEYRHISMARIDSKTKKIKFIKNDEIERYTLKSRQNPRKKSSNR